MSETTRTIRIGARTHVVVGVTIGQTTYINLMRKDVALYISASQSWITIPSNRLAIHHSLSEPEVEDGVTTDGVYLEEDDLPQRLANVVFITTKEMVIQAACDFNRPDFRWTVPPSRRGAIPGPEDQGALAAERLRRKIVRSAAA